MYLPTRCFFSSFPSTVRLRILSPKIVAFLTFPPFSKMLYATLVTKPAVAFAELARAITIISYKGIAKGGFFWLEIKE